MKRAVLVFTTLLPRLPALESGAAGTGNEGKAGIFHAERLKMSVGPEPTRGSVYRYLAQVELGPGPPGPPGPLRDGPHRWWGSRNGPL